MLRDKKKYSILVIEDNPGDYVLIQDYLDTQIAAPVIVHAENFTKAKKILGCNKHNFDVILLDLSLPDNSGEDLIADVLAFNAECPVIVLTGFEDIQFSIRSLSLGIADYLLKDDINSSSLYKSIIYNIERQKSLKDLAESQKKYSELFHLSPLPMWVYSLETLIFLDVNNAAIQHYGFSRDEFLSMRFTDIMHHDDIQLLTDTLHKIHNKEGYNTNSIQRHIKQNSELIHVELKGNILYFNGEKAEMVVANDITEKIAYVHAIEAQNAKLRDIAWMQSHIVRAPLARIIGIVDMFQTNNFNGSEKEEFFQHLLSSAYELDTVIKDISHKTYHA